jgi:hypothetical protein
VFAGFVAGYILALISTPLVSLLLLRLRAGSDLLERLLPAGTSAVGVSVLLHGALALLWTGFGIVLGLLLLAMRGAGEGAGSLNAPFSLFVAGLVLAIVAPVFVILRPLRRYVAGYALVVLLIFGWLMPYLAEWSTFES